MLAARLNGFGLASDVLELADLPRPEPGRGQILLEMLAAPVNPADLNIIEGKYGELPTPPAIIGNEGVGRVIALGEGAAGFSVGDLALPMDLGTWSQFMAVPAATAVRLPADLDPFQASMLTINPPSALLMLEDYIMLKRGEWIVQNAANSAVGRSVIQIARARGWRTLNVVRRPELIDELKALGGDIVITEDIDLRAEVRNLCDGSRPHLALNAVGGASALNLANALDDGGTMVTYGAMGRQPLKLPNGLLIFRLLNFTGFWLKRWKETAPPSRREEVFTTLAAMSSAGELLLPIHRTFPLPELPAALREAAAGSRSGKVLFDLKAS